jgi:hypothetical protein
LVEVLVNCTGEFAHAESAPEKFATTFVDLILQESAINDAHVGLV